MYTPDVGMTHKKFFAFAPAALAAAAGQNNGAIIDIKGLSGRALLMCAAGAAGANNTVQFNVQNSAASDMSGTPDVVSLYPVGSDVAQAAGTASAANTAIAQSYSINLDGLKRYLRVRALTVSPGGDVDAAAAAVLVAGGGRNLYSGGDI